MTSRNQWFLARSVLAVVLLLVSLSARAAGPKYVLLFIGDGMGFAQLDAASIYAHGDTGQLQLQTLPYAAEMTTYSALSEYTDSAASSTAICTGVKVRNNVISMAIPGDGAPLRTVLEMAREEGKSTGLVTTTFLTHATPAAFGAHVETRADFESIADDYLYESRPNVLLGGGGVGLTPEEAVAAGYTVVSNRLELAALDAESGAHVAGLFGEGNMPYVADGLGDLPSLNAMTWAALRQLEKNPQGFFLMVEGGRIDHAGHVNDIWRCIHETLAFDEAVAAGLSWAAQHRDTLVIVTADHETGGLAVVENRGQRTVPGVTWSTLHHTTVTVPFYALYTGPDWNEPPFFRDAPEHIDNADVFWLMTRTAPELPALTHWGARALMMAMVLFGFYALIRRPGRRRRCAPRHGDT